MLASTAEGPAAAASPIAPACAAQSGSESKSQGEAPVPLLWTVCRSCSLDSIPAAGLCQLLSPGCLHDCRHAAGAQGITSHAACSLMHPAGTCSTATPRAQPPIHPCLHMHPHIQATSACQKLKLSWHAAWEAAPSEAAALWRVRRRSAEWRAHWLELRLLDLARQAHVYQSQLAALRAAPQPQSPARSQQPTAADWSAQRAQAGPDAAVPAQALHHSTAEGQGLHHSTAEARGLHRSTAKAGTHQPEALAAAASSGTAPPVLGVTAGSRAAESGPLEPLELQQPPVLQERGIEEARLQLVGPRPGGAVPMEGVELQVSSSVHRAGRCAASALALHGLLLP